MDIANLLKAKGYEMAKEFRSDDFGDFFILFKKENIEIRIISDKSILYIDVRNNQSEGWIDLKEVQKLFSRNLTDSEEFSDLYDFLLDHLTVIERLFDKENFTSTIGKIRNEKI